MEGGARREKALVSLPLPPMTGSEVRSDMRRDGGTTNTSPDRAREGAEFEMKVPF